jgi:hypothetical protein
MLLRFEQRIECLAHGRFGGVAFRGVLRNPRRRLLTRSFRDCFAYVHGSFPLPL